MEKTLLSNCALIVLFNLLFYIKTFHFKYVSDDILSSQRSPEKNPFWHYVWVLEGKLKSVSYTQMEKGNANFHLPFVDHLITTLIHSFVCVGIYLGFGTNNVSLLAAFLFSVNPMNNQVAVWISGRGYALSALGMVWALTIPWQFGFIALMVACYSNAGFFMPIVLLGSKHPQILFFLPIVWGIYFNQFRKNVKQKIEMETFDEDRKLEPFKIILALKTFGFYVSHSLIPIKNTFYHSLLESLAGSKKHRARTLCRFFWIGLVCFLAMAWYVFTHKWDMICFGMLWWCVGIAPFLNIMRMQQEISERYAYLPNIGLMVILSYCICWNPYIVGAFIAMYATKMWFYMEAYKDDFWLIEYATMNSPDSWFAWNARAHTRLHAQSFKEAQIFWVIALNLSPKEFKLLMNIAGTLFMMGQQYHAEALTYVAQAENNIPGGQEKQCKQIIEDFRKGKISFTL
jgi:hypothetical protein